MPHRSWAPAATMHKNSVYLCYSMSYVIYHLFF